MIQMVDLLTPEECDQIRDGIHELKSHWIHRDAKYLQPFYTLGFGTYDAKEDLKAYYKEAPVQNLMLKRRFGWIYERLSRTLETAVGKPMFYDEELALPGFHIFLPSKAFETSFAAIHWDIQHLHLDWTGKEVSFEDTISYTAAIRLPKWGAGLNVWDLNINDIDKMKPEELEAVFSKGPHRYIAYQTGRMIVHSGETVHQIAPMKDLSGSDERITLQGWGVQSKGGYLLYW